MGRKKEQKTPHGRQIQERESCAHPQSQKKMNLRRESNDEIIIKNFMYLKPL